MAVATSAVREAQNGGEFVRAARDEAGIDIQVIRGDEEARLIYLGARGSLDLGKRRVALFDLGGGSLEVILADAQELYLHRVAQAGRDPAGRDLPVLGSAHARASGPSSPSASARRWNRWSRACAPWASTSSPSRSGTASGLASMLRADKDGGGNKSTVALKDLAGLEQRLGTMSVAARARLPGLDTRRADTIYAGAVVFRTVLALAGADEATLCETALREGIIADYVASNRPGILLVEEFPDLRRRR